MRRRGFETDSASPEGFSVVSVSSVAGARYREAMFNSWDKNDPKDARVILQLLKHGLVQHYHDPLLAGDHDLQELAKTYHQIVLARKRLADSLLNHYLPSYFSEMGRYWESTRVEWFVEFLEKFPTPAAVRALPKEAFVRCLDLPLGPYAVLSAVRAGPARARTLCLLWAAGSFSEAEDR